jgi:cell division septation protein DedD
MANGNVRVKERFELALDGRQIATIVVGALVTVSAVFVLGLKMGQHLAMRQAERPAVDLSALDRAPLTDAAAPAPPLAYAEALLNKKPAPPPPLPPHPSAAAPAAQPAQVASAPPPAAAPVEQRLAAPADPVVLAAPSSAPAPSSAASAPSPASGASAAKGFTVQLASATSRDDAAKVAGRVKSHGPRVVEADVPGKGHFFRVRVGRFEVKDAAERFRDDLSRETGLRGVVMPE